MAGWLLVRVFRIVSDMLKVCIVRSGRKGIPIEETPVQIYKNFKLLPVVRAPGNLRPPQFFSTSLDFCFSIWSTSPIYLLMKDIFRMLKFLNSNAQRENVHVAGTILDGHFSYANVSELEKRYT